jgi:hypothetical protein
MWQTAVEEIRDVRAVEPLGLGVADDLREGGAIGRIIGARFGDALPITRHQPPRTEIPEKLRQE